MRISDWSSDVCSSDLGQRARLLAQGGRQLQRLAGAAHVQRHPRVRRLQALEVAQGFAVVDALAVGAHDHVAGSRPAFSAAEPAYTRVTAAPRALSRDRKSTRLNSSHLSANPMPPSHLTYNNI